MKKLLLVGVLATMSLISAPEASALPPPDLVFQLGTAVWSGLGLLFAGLLTPVVFLLLRQKGLVLLGLLFVGFSWWLLAGSGGGLSALSVEATAQLYQRSDEALVMVDVREYPERALGSIPGSRHHRLVDLLQEGPDFFGPGEQVVFLCYSGFRAEKAAKYFQQMGVEASYLEGGLQDWVESGQAWEGELSLSHDSSVELVSARLSYEEVLSARDSGAVLVDARNPEHYDWWHPEGSVSIPAYYAPERDWPHLFGQLDVGQRVVMLCDGISQNCFSALITALELSKRGHDVLGTITSLRAFKQD